MYNSVIFNIFKDKYNHHSNFRTFLSPQKETVYLFTIPPLSLHPAQPQKMINLSISINLLIQDITYN